MLFDAATDQIGVRLITQVATASPQSVRTALLSNAEIALIDLRQERSFAQGHPLFAAQMEAGRIEIEAPIRLPRKDVRIVVYDGGEGLAAEGICAFASLGYTDVSELDGGIDGWRAAGYEVFQDVNSYCKAFGELVEARRHTPSLGADEVHGLIESGANISILDVRRFDEYSTMNIPGSCSVPSAELLMHVAAIAPDPATQVIVNCAGRTRSIIACQSLINAGIVNPVAALRNGTIGWTLAGKDLEHGQSRRPSAAPAPAREVRAGAREVAYRAGVVAIQAEDLAAMAADVSRTLYRFDVRLPDEYARGHLPGFRNVQGGQLVQETDHYAPVRGARIVLADPVGVRAWMTASWLAQMGWNVFVLLHQEEHFSETTSDAPFAPAPREHRYKRPYEGTDNASEAMLAYLDWEFGLVAQLERDGTHGFYVI